MLDYFHTKPSDKTPANALTMSRHIIARAKIAIREKFQWQRGFGAALVLTLVKRSIVPAINDLDTSMAFP